MAALEADLLHWVLSEEATPFAVPPWHGRNPGSPYDQLHTEVRVKSCSCLKLQACLHSSQALKRAVQGGPAGRVR